MTTFFIIMLSAANVLAYLIVALFYVGVAINNRKIANSNTFADCKKQLQICETAGILFAAIYWFAVSSMSRAECLKGYAALSGLSVKFAYVWIALALIAILLSVYLSVKKRDKDSISIVNSLRKTSFFMGVVFFLISFLVKV